MVRQKTNWTGHIKSYLRTFWKKLCHYHQTVKAWRWWERWPVYIVFIFFGLLLTSRVVDRLMPAIDDPVYGASFSIKASKELGNDWQANYKALLSDLQIKHLRLMSYWDGIEPQPGKFNFKDLDWQMAKAKKYGAKVSLEIGYRQPRWPECFEPKWVQKYAVDSQPWKKALYGYLSKVVNRYKDSGEIESWQLENEARNNWFGDCRSRKAPTDRLTEEFNLVKKTDPDHPVWMTLSDEHGLPLTGPQPDAWGFSVYRTVYSTNTPIHFYITYPMSDWYHRLRAAYINHITDRPVFIHELQLEPWGPKPIQELSIKEQDRSMSVKKMGDNLLFARKTGIKHEYLWGSEWWYWRKTKLHEAGPWERVRQALQEADLHQKQQPLCVGKSGYTQATNPDAGYICD